ncbi:hypothetical protein DY000_02008293 [Brassica cretica]|uniref:Uncharacterized protein n=1 Tax=Brassica cretica TaxID=69181 RepID=A0ABQ7C195_BRACR|nr:hypothetical protein DY000_02008293 [Brassica cretica]
MDRSEYDDRNTDEPSLVITQLPHMHAVRSLRSDRASILLVCYIATKLEAKLGRYIATERSFRSVATYRPSVRSARSLCSDRARAKARSLGSDRASVPLGHYVVTKLEPKLGSYVTTELEPNLCRYVATERPFRVATELFRNVDTTLVHAFSCTL